MSQSATLLVWVSLVFAGASGAKTALAANRRSDGRCSHCYGILPAESSVSETTPGSGEPGEVKPGQFDEQGYAEAKRILRSIKGGPTRNSAELQARFEGWYREGDYSPSSLPELNALLARLEGEFDEFVSKPGPTENRRAWEIPTYGSASSAQRAKIRVIISQRVHFPAEVQLIDVRRNGGTQNKVEISPELQKTFYQVGQVEGMSTRQIKEIVGALGFVERGTFRNGRSIWVKEIAGTGKSLGIRIDPPDTQTKTWHVAKEVFSTDRTTDYLANNRKDQFTRVFTDGWRALDATSRPEAHIPIRDR